MKSLYRIAHVSDLHFTSMDWSLSGVFSKRWLGNLNFLFRRKTYFDHARLSTLPALFASLQVQAVIITGDLSTTSAPAEFAAAKQLTDRFREQGMEVFCVPGNHDHYTKKAYQRRLFYDYFPSSWESNDFSLKDHGITAKKLFPGWWIVGLDTALALSWFYSTGYFHPATEQKLLEFLSRLPPEDQILLCNHFPFFQHESPRKQLIRGAVLQQIVEHHPRIKIYCHGHTHRPCQANLRSSQLPLILDAGSTSHIQQGGWHLIDLATESATVEFYQWNQDQWQPSSKVAHELV